MASYNTTRFVEELLEKTVDSPPSFTVNLYPEHWTLNNGSKFLYNNQIASLLDDVRAHRIPVDFLDLFEAAKVPFYDGCMIVELLDYRPQRSKEPTPDKPERTRVVLHPNSESLWADICAMNVRFGGKWTDRDALEVEARLVLATSPPLCLDPNPHLTRIANHIMRVSTPTVPLSLKRKAAPSDPEEDETDKARRAKIMSFMNSRQTRATPSYRILDGLLKWREKKANPDRIPTPASMQRASSPTKAPTPSITVSQAQSPATSEKAAVTPAPPPVGIFSRANGSVTPAPPTTHQFIHQTPNNPSTPNTHSPMLPQTYPSLQAATEALKRVPTPAQNKQAYGTSQHSPPAGTPVPAPTPVPIQQNPQHQPSTANTFQAPVQATQFMAQPPRGGLSKAVPQNTGIKMNPQQAYQLAPFANQQQMMAYARQQQQQHSQQQAMQHQQAMIIQATNAQKAAQANGRATPALGVVQGAPSPAAVARSSPMVASKQLGTRSPMPPTTQLPQVQQQQQQQMAQQHALAMQQQQQQQQSQSQQLQQQQHVAQHPQHTFTPVYNPAHLRPGMVHGATQIPQHVAAAAQAQAQAHAQAQAQAQAQGQRPASAAGAQQQQQQPMYMAPQMYSYAMGYQHGQPIPPQLQLYLQQQRMAAQARMNGQQVPQQVAAKTAGGMQGR